MKIDGEKLKGRLSSTNKRVEVFEGVSQCASKTLTVQVLKLLASSSRQYITEQSRLGHYNHSQHTVMK